MSLCVFRVTPPAGKMLGKKPPKLFTQEDGRVSLHPKSILADEVWLNLLR